MKFQIGIRVLMALVILSFVCLIGRCNSQSNPCPDGWVEWEGHCAAIHQPELGTVKEYQPSNEKPPSDKMPSWEREGIHADEPPSCAYTNDCSDQKAIDADKEGKKAAGIL